MSHSLFRFEYKGDRQPGVQPEELALNLSNLFTCAVEDVTPLATGIAYFIREDLNEFTAQSYLRQFKNIGAIGEVIKQVVSSSEIDKELLPHKNTNTQEPNTPEISSNPHCPKCLSEHTTEDQCLDCGIFFAKYLQHQQQIAQRHIQDKTHKALVEQENVLTDSPQDEESKKAAKWLSIASLFLTTVFIADGYLQEVHFFSHAGFDIGYIPFFMGHLALTWGSILFARSKGYTSHVGLLGVLSLIGLSILLLLPNRKTPNAKLGGKVILTAVACWIVSGVWIQNFMMKESLLSSTNLEAKALSNHRHVYPSLNTDTDNRLYEQEYDELMRFLTKTLNTLDEQSFRPDDVSSMIESSLNALAKYEIWLNYQRYLHVQFGVDIPEAINYENMKKQRINSFNVLQQYLSSNSPPRIQAALDDWLYDANPETDSSSLFWLNLNQYLSGIIDQIRKQQMVHRSSAFLINKPVIKSWQLDLTTLKLTALRNVNITTQKNTITLSGVSGPLKETPLTLAVYMKPYKKRFGKTGHTLNIEQISPGFPNKYLSGDLNVLKGYHANDFY